NRILDGASFSSFRFHGSLLADLNRKTKSHRKMGGCCVIKPLLLRVSDHVRCRRCRAITAIPTFGWLAFPLQIFCGPQASSPAQVLNYQFWQSGFPGKPGVGLLGGMTRDVRFVSGPRLLAGPYSFKMGWALAPEREKFDDAITGIHRAHFDC